MEIKDLDKAGLLELMSASGEIFRFRSDSKAWKRAFDLYHLERGEKLDMECGKCITKVMEWLKKV